MWLIISWRGDRHFQLRQAPAQGISDEDLIPAMEEHGLIYEDVQVKSVGILTSV